VPFIYIKSTAEGNTLAIGKHNIHLVQLSVEERNFILRGDGKNFSIGGTSAREEKTSAS